MTVRRGLVALGDSITRGRGGAPALGVHPQSWAQWLAEALTLPFTNLAVDGARAGDVVRDQLPGLVGPYDLATLYVGANDARAVDFDTDGFARDVRAITAALGEQAARVLVLTIPEDLGSPRARAEVLAANRILRGLGTEVCGLEDFGGARFVLPDAVHPTSPGMVGIARRALAALGEATATIDAGERTDAPARARYAAWYTKQVARDRRRRWTER